MRILLVRLSSFGDVVFTLPLARALHETLPASTLAWAVEEPLAPLLVGAPYVDSVLTTRTRVWRHSLLSPGTRAEIRAFLAAASTFEPDLIVDAQGLFKSAWVTALVPAERKVGFGLRSATERVNCLATRERVEVEGRPHVVDRALALAEHVTGRGGFDRTPDVRHLVAQADEAVDTWLARRQGKPFALFQPFSSARAKEWPAESMTAFARALEELGLDSIVRWGPGERERAEALTASIGREAELAPPAGPAASARLAARSVLFVGADTGPTHLAAAAGVPTIALYGPTDPARFGPVGPRVRALRTEYNRAAQAAAGPRQEDLLDAATSLLREASFHGP